MNSPISKLREGGLWLLLALLSSPATLRAELPAVTDADWKAAAPADDPKASLLVLFKRAEFRLMDVSRQQVSSSMVLEQRLKVLGKDGLHGGELEIAHGASLRIHSLTGRTRTPDGRVIPLPANAKFERRLSKQGKSWVTAVAFPGVEVGSIVELEAQIYFDSIFLEPWYLSEPVPVVYSEVVFYVPGNIQVGTWARDPFQAGLHSETTPTSQGHRVRVWANALPSVPTEDFGPPFTDLATQFGLVVASYSGPYELLHLFESWPSTCYFIETNYYSTARHSDRGVKQKARELAGKLGDPRQKAEALYRFVRDEIRNDDAPGVTLGEDSTVAKVLARGSGDSAEKALLLQSMLDAVDLKGHLLWANERSSGLIAPDVPNPEQFEKVLVAIDLPGGEVVLDPSVEDLAFGALPYDVEGGQALVVDVKKPTLVTLPSLPPEQNRRGATLELTVDDEGRASGTGELVFSGQHALVALGDGDPAKRQETWQKWLAEQLPGFKVDAVEVTPNIDAGEMLLHWTMAQRAEDVLGDEVTLSPSRPLGPVEQTLTLPAAERRTPVVLPFADRDEVTLGVTFPAGWRIESLPAAAKIESTAGKLLVETAEDTAQRRVTYHRVLDVKQREDDSREGYARLQQLYAQAAKQDAQALGLVRH